VKVNKLCLEEFNLSGQLPVYGVYLALALHLSQPITADFSVKLPIAVRGLDKVRTV
jgi:hypothetical protein